MNRKYTDEEIQFIKSNYQILTIQEIADALNRTYSSIFSKAQDIGLTKAGCKNNVWSKDEINFIIANYKNMTNNEIANELNRTKQAVAVKISKLNLKRESKYKFDRNKFETIETEYDAYWLGFLYADGYISSSCTRSYWIGVELQECDLAHLKKFNKYMNSNMHIDTTYKKSPSSNNISKIYKLCYTSKQLYENLEKCGCVRRKSKIITMPFNVVPNELMRHFIRGYFDGDGSCGIYHHSERKYLKYPRASITCGSKQFVTELKSYLLKHDITCCLTNDRHSYKLCFGGKENVIKFLRYMYDDSSIYLDRKFERYKNALLYSNI